ncbi:MAG: hypothetical protein CMJ83_13850 [Planctomycetes bacterium]|nr:hypothetical protein [Planctomycetota bacterium]
MLLITMNVIVILAALAAAFLTVAFSENRAHMAAQDEIKAFYIAEAGLNDAIHDLRIGGTGFLGSEQTPNPFNHGGYWTAASETASGRWTVLAHGQHGSSRLALEAVLSTESADGFFDVAAFGDASVTVSDDGIVDSYSSSQGTYLSQATNTNGGTNYAGSDGDVASNGDIALNDSAMIFGDAEAGSGSSVLTLGGALVDGSTSPSTSKALPPVVVPPEVMSLAPGSGAVVGGSAVIPAGNRRYNTLSFTAGATVTTQGPSTIVCDNLVLDGTTQWLIDATNGPVVVYVLGKLELSGSSYLGSNRKIPSDFLLFISTDNHSGFEGLPDGDTSNPVSLVDTSRLTGAMYAPNAAVSVKGNSQVFGSVIAKKLWVGDSGAIHFDTDLGTNPNLPAGTGMAQPTPASSGSSGVAGLSMVSWRKVAWSASITTPDDPDSPSPPGAK